MLLLDYVLQTLAFVSFPFLRPRHITVYGDVICHGVVAKLSFEVRVVTEIEDGVVQCRLHLSGLLIHCQF